MGRLVFLLSAFPLLAPGLAAQADRQGLAARDSVTVVPGAHYQARGFFAYFMGRGYRDLWTTGIRVPVVDLRSWGGGGLTPFDVGGGTTTQTLHLRGADGFRYVLRSVDKSLADLPVEFEGTPAEDLLQDQLSSFHPSGAVITVRLLDAVGVLHPQPEIVLIPDSPLLGEYREQFSGMLALFEERPDDLPDGQAGFAGSRSIVQTDDLFDELEEDPRSRVELRELLKARLVDLLVGDRDRSVNNHLWARFDDVGGGYVWRPVPRDRDQSFVRFDGFLKGFFGRLYDRRLVQFDADYPDIKGLTRNAWDIDRNLLVGLDRATWDATVEEVGSAITDAVITEAVSRMPREQYALIGLDIEAKLRARRDQLPAAARQLYDIVFRWGDIHGTDEDEVAVVDFLDGGSVRIALYERGSGPEPEGPPHYERVFYADETRELRVYLHGGDDLARIEGASESPIGIRLVGGGGRDEFVNRSTVSGIEVFDGGNATVTEGAGLRLHRRGASRPWSWMDQSYDLDWGSETIPEVRMSFDGDRGLLVEAGLKRTRYGFLARPYDSRTQARFGWSFGRSKPFVDYRQYFRGLFSGQADLSVRGQFSGLEVINFYGLGNETPQVGPASFHKVDQSQLVVTAALSFGDGERKELAIGPILKRTSSDTTVTGRFVAERDPYGAGTIVQLGVQASLEVDGRNHVVWPTGGYELSAGASYYPKAVDLEDAFAEAHGEVSAYLSPSGGNPTLATRIGGKRVWGSFPYYEAAFLGGVDNVRGLREQRYAGDTSVYGNAELRVFLDVPPPAVPLAMLDLKPLAVPGAEAF